MFDISPYKVKLVRVNGHDSNQIWFSFIDYSRENIDEMTYIYLSLTTHFWIKP